MQTHHTLTTLATLIVAVVTVTIVDSYVPHEMGPVRLVLALVQLGLMLAIATVTLRSVMREF